jgi:hypothetical protein
MSQKPSELPLRVAVVGMDSRTENLFRMFFRGPCQNRALVVGNESPEATLIDMDVPQGAKLFQQHRGKHPDQPVILLSINPPGEVDGQTIFVKKPAQAQAMLAAITRARELVAAMQRPKPEARPQPAAEDDKPAMKVVTRPVATEGSAQRAATLLNEQVFKSYLGHRDDVDPNDPKQIATLFYNPREYMQGHVHSAWEVAVTRDQPTRLETPWRAISFFPEQRLVHFAADEAQLRAVCGIPFRNIVSLDVGMDGRQSLSNVKTIAPDDVKALLESDQVTPLETFLWKVALLTSKGRIPDAVDPLRPIQLKRWPNMTRITLPPHAMRIAAILHDSPMTPFQAAQKLGIRQQYVFAFFSAAYALGLISQPAEVVRTAAAAPAQPAKAVGTEKVSLFKKILHRLKLS